ncbi:acyltransferase family protein [Nocardia sp. CA2R105]|uniref:lysophospholipid acyltransferase family protein n=1 Tax=Nocardia coffeae TaxID=2873381 RepID=UPI001CA6D31B|nr:lysophospholipid acyltransferase family protein [Nocardia coffeae]MBY8863426.1 acyltransferase family protein [Nocardia coffeae]
MTDSIRNALAWTQPSDNLVNLAFSPWVRWFSPTFYGAENLSQDRPTLYVANHAVWGTGEVLLSLYGVFRARGSMPRSLADRLHMRIPGWRDMLTAMGSVVGDREITRALMRNGQDVLVFPGGQREVFKTRSERYRLVWKQRTGFVRLAVEEGYSITPVGVAGADDAFDYVFDADDYRVCSFGRSIVRSGVAAGLFRNCDELPPIVRGIGLTPIPKPQPFHITYGAPIDLSDYRDRTDDLDAMLQARAVVVEAVESAITHGLERRRAQSACGSPLRRWLNAAT